jgi:Flp pilus assembly protein CpaB
VLLRHTPLPRFLVAGGLGIATFLVAKSAVPAPAEGALVEVTVLARDVPAGQVIAAADVRRARLPAPAVPRTAAATTPVGATASVDLIAGEVVLARRLGARGLAGLLPKGTRALTVPRAAGTPPLERGQRVDLVSGAAVLVEAATVIAVEESGITVALPTAAAPAVAEAVAAGTVTLLLAG